MNKKSFLILGIALIFLAVFLLKFAYAGTGCCLKTNDGAWCQTTDQTDCSTTVAPTSCDSFTQCIIGTCVNSNSGQCSVNVPKAACENEGGYWDPRPKSEVQLNGVNVCQEGCCSFGNNVAFVSQTECKRLGADYGVEFNFDGSITSESACFSTANPTEEGACVFNENIGETTIPDSNNSEINASAFGVGATCRRTTKAECNSIANSHFEPGLLCTAPSLGTDCARTSETTCGVSDKVYFKDTCGNRANVYDESMYSNTPSGWNPEMIDYWTYIREPKCDLELNPNGCGDCEILEGKICREYSKGTYGMPDKAPEYGEYVCADMGCQYDTNGDGKIENNENYLHGESWCGESPGIYDHLSIDSQTGQFDDATFKKLSNPDKYNLPGSRYTVLSCYDGEIIEEPCRDYRNEVCMEAQYANTGYKVARCVINDWRTCFTNTDKESCESGYSCKWVEGYRVDGQVVTTQTSRNQDEQGSCVPLISPGFDFWNPDSDASSICSSADFNSQIIYETHWTTKRDEFKDVPTKDASQRCIDNCYLIPDYGVDINIADYINFWKGESYGSDLKNYAVSLRKGYYCDGQGGGVTGDKINCASDSSKSSVFPIFLTHDEWLNSVIEKTRSLGDCGYKQSAYSDLGVGPIDKNLEIVTIMFQRLNQDGTPKDGNGTAQKLYVGGEYVGDQEGYRTGS